MVSKPVLELSEELRLPLWESLTAFAAKHRKFSNAQWVMPPEAIAKIEEAAAKLAPKSASLVHHRLFSEQDFELFEKLENYDEQQKRIGERRQAAVREILNIGKIDALLSFARSVKHPEAVGQALGNIDYESLDEELLPKLLNTEDKILASFIGGFVWGRYWSKKWEWVDSIAIGKWTSNQKAAFFALLPFGQGAWRRAESALGTDKIEYWSTVHSCVSVWCSAGVCIAASTVCRPLSAPAWFSPASRTFAAWVCYSPKCRGTSVRPAIESEFTAHLNGIAMMLLVGAGQGSGLGREGCILHRS
jgi:hypothetical protein